VADFEAQKLNKIPTVEPCANVSTSAAILPPRSSTAGKPMLVAGVFSFS